MFLPSHFSFFVIFAISLNYRKKKKKRRGRKSKQYACNFLHLPRVPLNCLCIEKKTPLLATFRVHKRENFLNLSGK